MCQRCEPWFHHWNYTKKSLPGLPKSTKSCQKVEGKSQKIDKIAKKCISFTSKKANDKKTRKKTKKGEKRVPKGRGLAIKPDLAGERKAPCKLILQCCYLPLSAETDLIMLPSAVICCSPVCCYCLLILTAACCCYLLLCTAICSCLLLFAMISCLSS